MAQNTRQPTNDETRELARKNIQADIQNVINFLMGMRPKAADANPELYKEFGHHLNRLIEAKKWINFVAFGSLTEESPKPKE